ncbi:Transporter, MFS superfamily [Weissella jogaejeotgali]|uniref:Transporter, MFS superfamily n=2 Tax=Weissella TaxID=46255 RepID=A0A1L6R974_9LACO|nr:MFS transporter [Weissella jogaejeotgali]APS41063.1 Transporter, MFS superfamily [Weissella jogaejeotgali]CCC56520.1 permease of the major facilitator superfamily [Weissella thailandensis fsh4-2]
MLNSNTSISEATEVYQPEVAEKLLYKMNTIQTTKTFRRIFFLTAAGLFLDAMDLYLASGVMSSFTTTHFSTTTQNSAFLSFGFLGLFIGSVAAGVIGDTKGRMKAFQWNLLLFGFFTFIGAFAPNMIVLIITRFISEIGLGAEMVTSFSIINEFAPVKTRGKWCTTASFIANIGAPVAMLLCLVVLPIFSWRGMFFIVGALALIFSYFRHNLPESPRWNIEHYHYDAAEQTLSMLKNEMDAEHKKPATIVEHSAAKETDVDKHLTRNTFVAIALATGAMVCQYTFTSWAPTLLVKQGIDIANSLSYSTLMMIGAPVGAFVGSRLVERIGRKLNIISAFTLVAILGVTYSHLTSPVGIVVVGFLLTGCFYVLNATIIGAYITELFSTKYRFRGAGVANGLAKLANFGMPYLVVFFLNVSSVSMVLYFIAGLAIVAAIITLVLGPETTAKQIN